ncbi:hypothetical protein NLY43_25370 [Mesorhizobium sp. C416B]|uniref:hypothetical protein n=1 Tax=unclassified Mesorhizobium TaxID=325217 RepID=UPI0003CE2722|nr:MULTISPECIES: hypothetical protein [unclassified Mesorhizobium]ESX55664.1 hypothetical protein X761_12770 [Mesorhizobium sp. LSHC424B00]ESX70543.1 hypothetical protein X758_18130 [Mesorhizobium sp. LSHC416B00]WJI66388.1 hypothetical protein NLY43_25370 [Mesorhizobium sp. C416B]
MPTIGGGEYLVYIGDPGEGFAADGAIDAGLEIDDVALGAPLVRMAKKASRRCGNWPRWE